MTKRNYVLLRITASGEVHKTVQEKEPSLDQLQGAVGGYIEVVPYFTACGEYKRGHAYCNEEGKIMSPPLPFNNLATMIWYAQLKRMSTDCLNGNVLFVARTDEEVT